jgi:ATP-dependent Clp protease protease subunit
MASIDGKEKNINSQKRYVYLSGEITEELIKITVQDLFKLEFDNPSEDIIMIIDSYGGHVDSMWALIDAMNLLRCNVHTLCVGKAMSAAAVILINGAKGKRYCTENSRIMIHKIYGGCSGQVDDIEEYTKELKRLNELAINFVLKKTNLTKKILDQKIIHDWFLSSQEALKYSIIDKIVSKFSEINLKGW